MHQCHTPVSTTRSLFLPNQFPFVVPKAIPVVHNARRRISSFVIVFLLLVGYVMAVEYSSLAWALPPFLGDLTRIKRCELKVDPEILYAYTRICKAADILFVRLLP